MDKKQTLEQQALRLKIAAEVVKSKARIKRHKNTREFNGKVDTASTFTLYPTKSKISICERDNPKKIVNANRREVKYNDHYQEYETKPHQFIDEKIVDVDFKSVRKVEKSVDIDANMRYGSFMALFSKVVETKLDDPTGRLTRLIKHTVGDPKELMKNCIQLRYDHGYQTPVTFLEKAYGNPHKILSSYQREVKE